MKRLILLCILSFALGSFVKAQGTIDIMLENPRIVDESGTLYFYFDVYGMKTGSWGTGIAAEQTLSNSSFYFTWNNTDGSNPSLETYNTTVFPAGQYSVTVGTTGAGNFKLYVDVTATATSTYTWVTDEYNFLFTVKFQTGGSSNTSNLSWLFPDTGITHYRFSTSGISMTETAITSGVDLAMDTKSWDGSANGNWDNAANWSPSGIPGATDDIIYPNNPSNELNGWTSMVTRHATVANLRVNHFAEMAITQNSGLTVTNDIELKGGPRNIILESGFTTQTLSYSFIPEGSIDYNAYSVEEGHIEVHRTLYYTPTAASYYMHQVAAPVDNVMLVDWDMIVLSTYAFEWRTATQEWFNIYATWRQTPPGYGFRVSLYGQSTSSYEDLVFMDNLVLTDQVISFDAIQFDENALIGNPYTAPIDVELMLPQTNVSNTVYVWDPATSNYLIYVAGTTGSGSARYIQPGQSFFIDATGNVSSFNIDLADRVSNIEPYLKSVGNSFSIKFYTEGGNHSANEAYICFKEADDVTTGYDLEHDGLYKTSEQVNFATELYTVGSDGMNLSVDARPLLIGDEVSVPLHFKPIVDETYRIVLDEEFLSSFPQSISIMLEDTFEPQQDWIDLRMEGYYEFEAEKYDPRDRFIVHFYDLEFGIDETGVEPIKIYSDRTDAFIINDSEQLIKEIQVYDVMGNLITRKATVNTARTRLFVSDKVGYYIVKVITDKAVYSEKVLITK